jgi:tetratricopeptide (TPR) repeat protein
VRAERLAPLLADPVRLVRMAAARALAGAPEQRFLGGERAAFDRALAEWTAAQRFNADRPEAWLNLGALQATRGDPAGATASFGEALALDASFVEASVNLADVQRSAGDEAAAERTLRDALARNPQAAGAHHALGLALVRQRRLPEALLELAKADDLAPGEPRYAYVLAVARHDTRDVAGATATLERALARHPHDRDLAAALAAYRAGR